MKRNLLLPRVRGPYHQALLRLLLTKYAEKAFTQDSLAAATGVDQTTIGQYLKRGKAGTLDLDEADAALAHIGSSLKAFIADPANAVTPIRSPRSLVSTALAHTMRDFDDEQLLIVLGAAQSVRAARARRAKTQSVARRAADHSRTIRKTGGTR